MSTNISYADETWSPSIGCRHKSESCTNCFAQAVANRGMCEQHKGLTDEQGRWTGEVRLIPKALEKPLRWGPIKMCLCCDWESGRSWCPTHIAEGARTTRNRIVLTPTMGDGLHDEVPDEFIAAWFGVMAAARNSTFLFLTKRIERFLPWVEWLGSQRHPGGSWSEIEMLINGVSGWTDDDAPTLGLVMDRLPIDAAWPPQNIVIGTTVENQRRADERLPHMARIAGQGWRTWLSYEPALSAVNFGFDMPRHGPRHGWRVTTYQPEFLACGSETGPGARPCDVDWLRSAVDQCRDAFVRCHVKQLSGSNKPEEWPHDLRVREMVKHG